VRAAAEGRDSETVAALGGEPEKVSKVCIHIQPGSRGDGTIGHPARWGRRSAPPAPSTVNRQPSTVIESASCAGSNTITDGLIGAINRLVEAAKARGYRSFSNLKA
jgi:hypothetical protein